MWNKSHHCCECIRPKNKTKISNAQVRGWPSWCLRLRIRMNTYLELGLFPLYIRSLWSPQGTIGRLYDPWCEGHWSDPLRDGARFSMIRTDLSVTAGSHACLVRDLSSACSTGRVSYEAPFPLSAIYEEQYCWLLSSIPTSISEVSHLNRILSSRKFPPDEGMVVQWSWHLLLSLWELPDCLKKIVVSPWIPPF